MFSLLGNHVDFPEDILMAASCKLNQTLGVVIKKKKIS